MTSSYAGRASKEWKYRNEDLLLGCVELREEHERALDRAPRAI
jgi:hypothetical protein